ncbi:MAG: PadR family transcriptional regulator [Acidobacteria bacterium]|nr:PadR family transcriptional regulator [Acidobacteriota bacterium]
MTGNARAAGLVKGTLDLLVLKALSNGKMHGYGISLWLERVSSGRLGVEDSAIYQALQRLRGRGLIEAGWGTSKNNRRARYYELTSDGRRQLEAEAATWHEYAASVAAVLADEVV